MSVSLHSRLKEGLSSLAQSIAAERGPLFSKTPLPTALPPISPFELTNRVQDVWDASQSDQGSSAARRLDAIRGVMDLVGRDLVVSPVVNGNVPEPLDDASDEDRCRFQTSLQDRLDIVLTLYEVVRTVFPEAPSLEPGVIFIPLLEELVELISVETWRALWSYVETRSKRFTKDMPASKGKALPLLRTINAFLRFLPRTPDDLVFRGRVHQFASSVISIADKSAINMRGDYNDIKTTWDEAVQEENEEEEMAEADGDVSMGSAKEEAKDETAEVAEDADKGEPGAEKSISEMPKREKSNPEPDKAKPEPDFYSTLWSLQQYFAHPPSLDGPATRSDPEEPLRTPFEQFKIKSDFVLPELFEQTQRERKVMGKEAEGSGKKRKRTIEDEGQGGFFHPRYLTGKRLLQHELADPSFRRQILVQYFILFQFLLNLTPATAAKQAFTGGMPKSFIIDQESEAWVKTKVASIKEELRKMLPDGKRFEETVLSIITREHHYAQWKNDGCPESGFEIPPMDKSYALEASEGWKKRLAPLPQYPFKVGSRSLSRLWNRGFSSIDQLKGWKRATTVQSLDQEIQKIEVEEEDDKAMGHEPSAEHEAENAERKTNRNWRALRLAATTDLRHFTCLVQKREIHTLLQVLHGAGEAKTAIAIAEDEKTDDEDVEGLKRGSKELTADKSVSVEEAKEEAAALEEAVKMEAVEGEKGVGAVAEAVDPEDKGANMAENGDAPGVLETEGANLDVDMASA